MLSTNSTNVCPSIKMEWIEAWNSWFAFESERGWLSILNLIGRSERGSMDTPTLDKTDSVLLPEECVIHVLCTLSVLSHFSWRLSRVPARQCRACSKSFNTCWRLGTQAPGVWTVIHNPFHSICLYGQEEGALSVSVNKTECKGQWHHCTRARILSAILCQLEFHYRNSYFTCFPTV